MSDTHALLIGIDAYLPNKLPNGGTYAPLSGCVKDVLRVEEYLKTRLGLPAERITKLTARIPEVAGRGTMRGPAEALNPVEPPDQWPTYANMVAAFKRLTEIANPGDELFIHYSGHGGRAATIYEKQKGKDGLDEGLVPVDIGKPEGQYLRDLQLAYFLAMMVDKKLRVTLVLDSCHAGGATRDETNAVARGPRVPGGRSSIDTTLRPADSLVAPLSELLDSWASAASTTTRNVTGSTPWLPEPKGYVLLAACRPQESAFECTLEDGDRGGALTYWLLDALRRSGPASTYAQLHDRVLAKVHSQFYQQTPMLLGEGNRVVFGAELAARRSAVNVLSRDPEKGVLLNTGQAQGIRKGARFIVYPQLSGADVNGERLGVVEVVDYGATESWAKVVEEPGKPFEPGDQAVLTDPGSLKLQSGIRLIRQGLVPAALEEQVLGQLKDLIVREKGFLWLPGEDKAADFEVAINARGEIEIAERSGIPIANVSPVLPADELASLPATIARLVHLTKNRAVRQLDNLDASSPLAGKLVAELLGVQTDYDPADRPEPEPFQGEGNICELNVGEWTFLRMVNQSSRILNIAVLDLQPDWGVAQIFPGEREGAFFPLDPGKDFVLPLHGDLPVGIAAGSDLLKVIATIGNADFHWLELPSLHRLDDPKTKGRVTRGGPSSPLEQLFAAISGSRNGRQTRDLSPSAFPSEQWVTAQVEVKIRRK